MKYVHQDLILPGLNLPDPCPIEIETRDDGSVVLKIGPRDWLWNAEGRMVECGTTLVEGGYIA